GRCAHSAQREIAVGGDVADHVPHFVERTGDESSWGPAAATQRDVAGAVADAPREEREQRVGHRLLEPGDGGHGGEANCEVVNALGGQSDGRTGGQQEKDDRSRGSDAEAWASPSFRMGTLCALVIHRAISLKVRFAPRTRARLDTAARAPAAPRASPAPGRSGAASDAPRRARHRPAAPGPVVGRPAGPAGPAPRGVVVPGVARLGRARRVGAPAAGGAVRGGPAAASLETTRATRATSESANASSSVCRFVPAPETST